jgi:hypothetical protein
LLHRIVTPDIHEGAETKSEQELVHFYTHGICSDPMAVFAIVFSALIHDVDHQGISNVQLMKEEPTMGELYRGKSIAEQNSIDVAFDELMADQFINLRKFIFGNQKELMRFRQLVINVVLATDIFDKEINELRKKRWERAFHPKFTDSPRETTNLRATIVMEHIVSFASSF